MKLIVPIVGFPFSGKRTLASHLSKALPISTLGFDAIRLALEKPSSDATHHASRLVSAGELIPDTLLGTILRELVEQDATRVKVLIGLPRSVAQLEGLLAGPPLTLLAFFLDASVAELNRRFAIHGDERLDVSHPGSFVRFRQTLEPLLEQLNDSGTVVVLNGDDDPVRVFSVARDRLTDALRSSFTDDSG